MDKQTPVPPALDLLLGHLAAANSDAGTIRDWRYTHASGGANNLVCRAAFAKSETIRR